MLLMLIDYNYCPGVGLDIRVELRFPATENDLSSTVCIEANLAFGEQKYVLGT